MQTVYHNTEEKVLIQSDKDTDGRTIYLVVDGNVVGGSARFCCVRREEPV